MAINRQLDGIGNTTQAFSELVPQYRGDWAAVAYQKADVVRLTNGLFIANSNVQASEVPRVSSKWDLVIEGQAVLDVVANANVLLPQMSQAVADTEQATDELRSVVATYNLGREPNNTDPAGNYRVIRAGVPFDVVWNGTAETGASAALATAGALDTGLAQRPVFNKERWGTLQGAIDAAPGGATVDLSAGELGVTTGLIVSPIKNLKGGYWNAPIIADPSLSTPLMTVRPPDDNNSREGFVMEDMALLADSSNQTALQIDTTGPRRMNRAIFSNLYLRSGTGWAMEIQNEPNEPDGFATSTVMFSALHGGVYLRGGGDSLNFIGNGFYGGNAALDLTLITNKYNPGHGDSSKLLMMAGNSTANGGFYHRLGTRPAYVFNNFECGAGPGANEAVIYLEGDTGATIDDAYIAGNFIAGAFVKYGVRLGATNRAMIFGNSMAATGAIPDSACIYITADTKNANIGPNHYEGTPIKDEGVGTMGIYKTLSLAAGVTSVVSRPAQFIKLADGFNVFAGTVRLMGQVSAPNTAGVLGTLPYGFHPEGNVWALAFVQDSSFVRGMAMVYVDTTGAINLLQTVAGLSADLAVIELSGISFLAPLV